MSVTLAPVRLVLAAVCLVSAWLLATLAMSFRSPEEAKKPLSKWRNLLRPLVVFLSRGVFFWGGFHWIAVRGKRASVTEAPVLALAPHSSYFDALVVTYLDLTTVVAKTESDNVPLFGTLIRFTQPVYVRREDPDSRVNTIKEIQQRAQSGGQWPQIIIFPEGTCTNRSCLITFKPGAFYPGVPVQPVCLRYPNRLDTVTWTWDGPGAFVSLWLSLCQIHNRMEIEYLPVYYPSEEEKNDAKLYARNVRAVMAEHLKVPVTDHTYDDCRLMLRAAKLNMPMAAGLIEFHKLHKKLGLSYEQMQQHLHHFQAMVGSRRSSITLEELGSYLKMPQSDALKELFRLYDRDQSGSIDFREYVIGLSLVSGPANTEETVKYAFQLFDADNKGYIDQAQLTQILNNAFKMEEPDVQALFEDVDQDSDGKITFDEFKQYSEHKPEYAALFTAFHGMHQNGHPPVMEDGSGDRAKVD